MTENSYAATATAEKRLREVLAARFGAYAEIDDLAKVLLEDAEIEYLPRKKSVSIRLTVPEFASKGKPTVTVGTEQEDPANVGIGYAEHVAMTDQGAAIPGHSEINDAGFPKELPHDRQGPARIGTFEAPSGDTVPIYEDDFFTE